MPKLMLDEKILKIYIKKILICVISVFFLGISVALNTKADLGNDPIAVFYDGLGRSTGINMGIAANMINSFLALSVFILDRKYIHIGTIIYAVVLGLSITFGLNVYEMLNLPTDLWFRWIVSFIGYALAFIALSAFVAIDIGIDPWTALAIIVSKKIKKAFGVTKFAVDALTFLGGALMGGSFGVMTLFAVIAGGPSIQRISGFLDKVFLKMLKCGES